MKILYHANCTDGSGAALSAWMHFGEDEKCQYIPVQYGNPPPEIEEGEMVVMLDFSYPRDIIMQLATVAGRILIIDHHKTAQADLADPFPESDSTCQVETVFDMDKSGAVLTWEYFFPDGVVPPLLKIIQDRDLWKFDMEGTNDVIKGLSVIDDWRKWRQYLWDYRALEMHGFAINSYLAAQTKKIIKTGPITWHVEGDTVPVYNLPGFMLSDTLHAALEEYPYAPYAVGYFDLPDKRVYSLRSRSGSDVDVSDICKKHGGGGHKHAAGFSVATMESRSIRVACVQYEGRS